ncbi:uncharacterized protein LOC133305473 isoform X2 [Gastrolobium bilobum]|uniref:uncharacterized protein LOC133305473 isoform X2 n=1 Tax=Gastrolobium bilobum TaxID=150636 RepID=UPI002AB10783|nr:uncharacterized protein LOC133305473 isoform X2 [Gastrolobium bilobum]
MRTSSNTRYPENVVRELHRVYSVQKKLMDELKNGIRQQKFWNPTNVIDVRHPHAIEQQHQTTQNSYGYDFNIKSLREDMSSIERSESCSEDTIKMRRGFDLEKPAEEDIFIRVRGFDEGEAGPSSCTAFQSCKISSGGSDKEMEVDLTLSIGGSQVKNSHLPQLACSDSPSGKTRELNSSTSHKSDRVGECSDPTTPISSSTVTFTQERKGPHWLSQGLKLK